VESCVNCDLFELLMCSGQAVGIQQAVNSAEQAFVLTPVTWFLSEPIAQQMGQIFLKMSHTQLSGMVRIDGTDALYERWEAIRDNAWRSVALDVVDL